MIYKKGRYYMVKFMWQGRMIRKSSRCTNAKDARAVEGKIRSELSKGNWDILEAKPRLTLEEFLRKDFLPYTESKFQSTPKTKDYYNYGANSLLESDLAELRLDQITGQHAQQYAARLSAALEVSTINCGLRTLRRALNLAEEWGKLDRAPKISLAKGERERERVLTEEEAARYLDACPQPWRDVATIMLGTGMCPGELYPLRWENVLLTRDRGLIQIIKGKTKARRRFLSMVPAVFGVFTVRQQAQGYPSEGWVFPSGSASGHLEQGSAKNQHAKAIQLSGVKSFEPYVLRHTGLTDLAETGCDSYTLAKIAGHSSITITQRYCHPQAEAIERAFERKAAHGRKLVTCGSHPMNLLTESGRTESSASLAVSVD